MRKTLATLILAVMLLFCSNVLAQTAESELRTNLSKATIGLYQAKQACKWVVVPSFFFDSREWTCEVKSKFVCTATVFSTNGDGDYLALTAGHCFDWEHIDEYYVSDEMSDHPALKKTTVVKFEDNTRYDYGVVRFHSTFTEYPPIKLAGMYSSSIPAIGAKIINVNFSLGLIKQSLDGRVVSGAIGEVCKDCRGRFLVSIGIAPGASGSAVVNEETGEIVGLVEMTVPGTQMATIVIPVGVQLANFMDDDSVGIKPKKAEPAPETKPAETKKKKHWF
jgi:hypothetical protein